MRSLHTAASVIGIIHDHKSFPDFLVPSYVNTETAVHWNSPYDGKQGCHPCLHLLIRYTTNSKKEISICVAGMVAVTIAAAAEIMEDAAMDAAAAVTTGDGTAPVDGTGMQEKHSEMASVMVMMPVSVMVSGKGRTMTEGRADLVVRGSRMKTVDAAELNIGGFMPPIILPASPCFLTVSAASAQTY